MSNNNIISKVWKTDASGKDIVRAMAALYWVMITGDKLIPNKILQKIRKLRD